jgi:hypothetical protein
MKGHFWVIIWTLATLLPGIGQESAVLRFDTMFTIKGTLKYNFMQFDQDISANNKITSNRPLDLGIGFGYKDFSFGFSVNIPFLYDQNVSKSNSFDFGFNCFFRNALFFEGLIKYYEGFHTEQFTLNGAEYGGEVGLKIIMSGISGEYLFNKEHSLRGIYNLDRKQRISNASFILGGGVFYSALYSDDAYVDENNYNQHTIYFGPNAGYSYIWILSNNFFLNILCILGINGSVKNNEFYFGFHALPKFAFGYHGVNWSFNAVITNTLLIAMQKIEFDNIINSGACSITFSRRF